MTTLPIPNLYRFSFMWQTRLFKIESYEKLDVKKQEEIESLVDVGNIMRLVISAFHATTSS